MSGISLAFARRSHVVSIIALLAAPLSIGCTEHRSIFSEDAGPGDAGPDDGGVDGGNDAGPSDGGTGSLVSIRIDGIGTAPLAVGSSVTLHVTGLDGSGNPSDVTAQATLTSSAPAVASVTGDVLLGVARGTAIIHASLTVEGSATPLTAQAPVMVQNPNQGTTVSVQVTPATLSLAPGLGSQLAANATQGDGSQLTITTTAHWQVDNTAVCTVDNNLQKGFVTAVAVGTCNVSAAYGGKSGAAAVTVSSTLTVTALAISPTTLSVGKGATGQLTVTATLSDSSTADATSSSTWTTSDGTIAAVQAGLVTGVAVGGATVTATLGALSVNAAVTVTAASVTAISVSPPQTTIAAGLTQQFAASAVYSDGTTADVTQTATWTTSAATIATIDATTIGLVDAVAPGRATVTATLGTASGSAIVNVNDAIPTRITLQPSPITLPAGVSQQVVAIATFSDNSVRNVSSNVTWSVADVTLATVSSSGLLSGVAAGSTTLTATLGGVTASDALTITAAQLVQILLLPQNSAIAVGGTESLTATGIYGDNSLHDLTALATWTSTTPAVATVSNAAGTQGQVTGVAAGNTTITATMGSITSGPASITVNAAALVSISMAPAMLITAVFITVPARVTARYADGSELDVTTQAVFSSSDTTIATVVATGTDAGECTGSGQGQATINASFGGQTASSSIFVAQAMLNSITISPLHGAIEVGQSAQLQAMANFQGAPIGIDVTTLVTWTSSDQTVGRFVAVPNGLFTAQGAGTCTVAAELDGVSGTRSITVSSVTPVSIAVVQATLTIPTGVTRALVAIGTYADNSTQDLTYGATWTSDANAVAVVGDTGNLKGLVTGVSAGTAHISATLDGISGQSTVTVDAANAVSLQVTPVNPIVTSGGGGGGGFRASTEQFYATAHFDDNTDQDVTDSAVWTSSDPTVATISDQTATKGLASVIAAGGATITATFRTLTASSSLTSR